MSIDDTALVETMAAISDSFEAYGYRRMQAALRHRGFVVNGGRIPGHRGGVKAGHWRWGAADMARAPIGALAISRCRG